MQSEVAAAVAAQLELALTRDQRRILETPPTTNPRAYEQLMLARALISAQNPKDAVRALQLAVAMDPTSPVLFAELATAQYVCCFDGEDVAAGEARRAASKAAVDRALALDAGRPEVQLALATDLYYRTQDNARAIEVALPALAALPNEVGGRVIVGFLLRRVGRWQEAQALFSRAAALDPRNLGALDGLFESALALRSRDDFEHVIRLQASADPDGEFAWHLFPAALAFDGDIRSQVAAYAALPPALRGKPWAIRGGTQIAFRIGDFAAARDLLLRQPPSSPDPSGDYEEQLGLALQGLGDAAGARGQFERALERARSQLAKVAPDNLRDRANWWSIIGYRLALLGQERAALEHVRRADELVPFEADAADGTNVLQTLVVTHAALGRDDDAIAALERLFSRPSNTPLASSGCGRSLCACAPIPSSAR